jgi:hypothetical protein
MENTFSLAIMEYEKLRDESLQAIQAQQSTLQWSMASFGAIIGGTALLVAQKPTHLAPLVIFAIFGATIPAFILCCGMSWIGELFRMERIGVYLRGLELEIARALNKDNHHRRGGVAVTITPGWETFIAAPPQRMQGVTKQRIGYIGSIGIYIIAMAASLTACIWYQWSSNKAFLNQELLYTMLCVIEFIIYFCVGVHLGRNLSRASRAVADIPTLRPLPSSDFHQLARRKRYKASKRRS